MYCKNCGHQIDDDAAFCPNCGAATAAANANTNGYAPANVNAANVNNVNAANAPVPNTNVHGIALAAKIIIILNMIIGFWFILPLIFGGIALSQMKRGKPSVEISICVLLLCSLIGGILLLCTKNEDYI